MKRGFWQIVNRTAWRVFAYSRGDDDNKDWLCTGDFGGHGYQSCGWEGACHAERCKSCGRVGTFPGEVEAECPWCGEDGEVEEACPQCGAPAVANIEGHREYFGFPPSDSKTMSEGSENG